MNKPAVTDTALSPRAALRDVQRSLADATKVHTTATDSSTKAKVFVDEAEAALATFDRVDDAGGDHLAQSISAWTRGGPRPTLAPPPDVAVLRAGRLAAVDDLAAARSALAGLLVKAAEAAGKVTAFEAQRENLCVLIMRQEEAALVARVKAADAACQGARDTLEAFLGLHVGIGGRTALFPSLPETVALFHTWPTTPQRPIGGGTLTPLTQPYTALFARLATDADAELELPFVAPPTVDAVTLTLRDRAKRMLGA